MNDMYMIRPSARYMLVRLGGTFLVVDSIYALLIVVALSSTIYTDYPTPTIVSLLVLHVIKFLFLVFLLSDVVIRFLSVRYYVTKHHLIVGSGIVSNDQETFELSQIRKVEIYQDWMGRKLNYGTLKLELTAPGYERKLNLVNVANPTGGAKEIEKFLGTDLLIQKTGTSR